MMPGRILISLFIFSVAFSIKAQTPVFTYLRESEGLTSNSQWSSNAIYIDEHEFVWIATNGGLNRYDGYNIKAFDGGGKSPFDLPYNSITAISGDQKGNIWLGTEEEGMIKFDPRLETFNHFNSENYLPDSIEFTQINNLITDQEGNIYICDAFQGNYKYFVESDSLVFLPINHTSYEKISNNNIALLKDGRCVFLSNNGVFIQNPQKGIGGVDYYPIDRRHYLSDAIELPDGKIQLFAQNYIDYFLIDPNLKEMTIKKNVENSYTCGYLIDPNENLWRSLYDGMLVREDFTSEAKDTFDMNTDISGSILDVCAWDMIADQKGNIYYNSIATGAGKFNYEDNGLTFLNSKHSGHFRIHRNRKFLAKDGQLFCYQNDTLVQIPLQTTNLDPINYFEIDSKGQFWICRYTGRSFFEQYDSTGIKLGEYDERGFTHMHEGDNGKMIVGGYLYEKELEELPYDFIGHYYERLSGQKYPDFKAKYFLQLKNGDIWIATFADGVIRILENQSAFDFLPIDENGNGKLNSNNPYYFFESQNGLIYVCTDKGICIWNPNTKLFSYINNSDEGILLDVKGMAEDEAGNIWMVMKNHIGAWDAKNENLKLFNLHPDYQVERLEAQDLQKDNEGFLYYQGRYGVVQVDPKKLDNHQLPENVIFTDLYINRDRVYPFDDYQVLDSSLIYQQSFEVPFMHRDVGFSFVSMHSKELLTKYFYRLKGYHDEWIEAPENRTLHFTSLNPGNYELEVKAKTGSGYWTNDVSSIKFHVNAPWYQRWWAYTLYLILLSLLAYAFYKYRVRQLLKYQLLRTKISSDLHDDVGSILGSIAMESEMLSYDKTSKISEELKRLSSMTRDAMSRMRDTVWAIDARKDQVGFLSDRMKDYLNDTLRRSNFEYNFTENIHTSTKKISPDIRQNVYLIFKEAINNTLKHSNGNLIEVSLNRIDKRYEMSIHDNGQIKNSIKSSGLGLTNMKYRAELIGADLEINTDNGFQVIVRFSV